MRFVFVHGWGFDPAVWDRVAEALPGFAQTRIDLGFLGGAPTATQFQPDDILIGHSLGFLWGLTRHQDWRAVIAINGFARFAGAVEDGACVRPAALRALRLGLARDAEKTLATFYRSLDHTALIEHFDAPQLAEGLALLETQQITKPLAMPGLVLAARNDPLVPVTACEHLAAIAGTTVTWREEGGHLLPLTQPQGCADAIRAFLA
jgi:pimeloyl-[acyl-carrier protein] methyl ester esterase